MTDYIPDECDEIIRLIDTDLDRFTQLVKDGQITMSSRVEDYFILNHCMSVHSPTEYYYVLRTLPALFEGDGYMNFILFSKDFHDEQFIKKAYEANPKIRQYITNTQYLMYVEKSFPYNLAADVIRGWNTLKASLVIGAV